MRKSDKKLENTLRLTLTDVCDSALASVPGFCWITHQVDYQRFSDSLRIIAVFDTDTSLDVAKQNHHIQYLQSLIVEKLADEQIKLKRPEKQIFFDSEEACELSCGGDWAQRFSRTLR